MADAYGMVTLSKSEDCNFDSEGLQKCLNQFEWDNSGAKWCISSSGNLHLDGYGFDRPQYPRAIPREVKAFDIFDKEIDGVNTFYQKSPQEMTEDDWDKMAGSVDELISLEKLSGFISPLMESGWIEVACVANEKSRYVYFELFRIYSDGRAHLKSIRSGPYTEQEDLFEEYFPSNSWAE